MKTTNRIILAIFALCFATLIASGVLVTLDYETPPKIKQEVWYNHDDNYNLRTSVGHLKAKIDVVTPSSIDSIRCLRRSQAEVFLKEYKSMIKLKKNCK